MANLTDFELQNFQPPSGIARNFSSELSISSHLAHYGWANAEIEKTDFKLAHCARIADTPFFKELMKDLLLTMKKNPLARWFFVANCPQISQLLHTWQGGVEYMWGNGFTINIYSLTKPYKIWYKHDPRIKKRVEPLFLRPSFAKLVTLMHFFRFLLTLCY